MRKYDEVQELIKRLRNNKVTLGHGEYGIDPLCELAAKELEAITAQLVSCDSQTTMDDNIVERLRDYAKDDHERGCSGRYYDCHCGYDDKRDQLIDEAAAEIDHLRHLLRINTEQQSEHIRTLIKSWEKERSILTDQIKNLRQRVEHAEWLVDKYRQDE